MAKKSSPKKATKKKSPATGPSVATGTGPLRFAHPFFTTTPKSRRKEIPGVGKGLSEYPSKAWLLEKIPPPKRNPPTMTLDEIVGASGMRQIKNSRSITFQAVGDTGSPDTMTEIISAAMSEEFDIKTPGNSPAFLFHLGDVIYYDNTDKGYLQQFYTPYKHYPGKIIAIPGNHDGETVKYDQPGEPSTGPGKSLDAFQQNFCQDKTGVPPAAKTIYREMISQPAVYWYLNAPFVDIVSLYSNVADGPGYIADDNVIGAGQKDWLTETLKTITAQRKKGQRKALIIAVHHPPFSGGGHSPSPEMLKDMDSCCQAAGIMPDMVVSGHSHNYQRFTRFYRFQGVNMQIPYLVVGCSGHGVQHVGHADGSKNGDHTFDSSLVGYGYLTVKVDKSRISIKFTEVQKDGTKGPFDKTVVVDLATNQIVPA
ncbi:MAG: metallophosphoesterase [Bacteroidota bacterium]|nr:metallophosphoesterase [Bacteroidota bacterium]